MPTRMPSHRPPRIGPARLNAAARGYCDKAHKQWRLSVLMRDAWQCRACGRVCGGKGEAHADHVSPIVAGTDRCEDGRSRYDISSGQTLCVRCHSKKTAVETAAKIGRVGRFGS